MKPTVFQSRHINIADVQRSSKWFSDKARSMRSVNRMAIMRTPGATNQIKPGGLYFFFYDPKCKDTLPFWDTFPMVFPLSATSETFYGLNMHYLPYDVRFRVFEELLKIHGTSLDDNKKMKMKWEVISGISKLGPLSNCIKQYRFDHVQSPFVEVPKEEWATAMMMPVHNFVGASASKIWSRK